MQSQPLTPVALFGEEIMGRLIFPRFTTAELLELAKVCKTWRDIAFSTIVYYDEIMDDSW